MPAHSTLELNARDIQDLADVDAVVKLFTRLGYNTDARRTMQAEHLGLSRENASRLIQHVELVAAQAHAQTTQLQIYLIVVNSITVETINELRKGLKNSRERLLLVLTTQTFQRLEFVLLERFADIPATGPGALAGPRIRLVPRRFTVSRAATDTAATRRALRFLRQLAYTATDVFAQFERLTSTFTAGHWGEEHFDNRALFADYYLKDRLPDEPAWDVEVTANFHKLRQLLLPALRGEAGPPDPEQSQGLIQAVLELLGFVVCDSKKAQDNVFTLCLPGKDKHELALCLHYPWGRFLDGKDDSDADHPDQNPGAHVVLLQSERAMPWAMVTNGLVWRLYSLQAHSRATNFYEINLAEILSADAEEVVAPAEAFKYFWLFFRSEAFEPRTEQVEGQPRERCFLDRVAERSADYAKKLGERLKERVFVEVFPQLAEGFFANIRQRGLHAEITDDVRSRCFQGTLTLLYRLLFLLYAEARDLLPVDESNGYFEASLKAIKEESADAAGRIKDEVDGKLKKKHSQSDCGLYERLLALCRVIDKGDADLNVPQYNGGLFITDPEPADATLEAETARFLRDTQVPDYYLALAVDLLSRDIDDKRKDLAFIDYKSLGVRQLGSIYEGLLEFKLLIADRKLGVKKEKGKDIYVPFSELTEREKAKAEGAPSWERRIIPKGRAYLENDKRERKATGSYYTPDYIVKYIVEQAVGPVVKEKLDRMRKELNHLELKWLAHLADNKLRASKGHALNTDESFYRDSGSERFIEDLFDIKVLDPAMGSGHFLVEAVDFITDKLVAFLAGFPWNPVSSWHLPRMRKEIVESTEKQGVNIGERERTPRRLTDVNLLKRHVLKRCTFGVDLNPMAVELAKVSLWLDCFTLGAPLSFLDHHLRCGNSLIGVGVEEVRKALRPKQMGVFESQFVGLQLATELMSKIGALSDITIGQAEESRREYLRATDELKPFKRILDIYTSTWFGNTPEIQGRGASKRTLYPAVDLLNHPAAESLLNAKTDAQAAQVIAGLAPELRQIASTVFSAAREQRFFHWELEFPEVFYQDGQRAEHGGFDAVIGNPPYGDILEALEKEALIHMGFESGGSGNNDVFRFFNERSLGLCAEGRLSSFIIPNTCLAGTKYGAYRSCISAKARILRLLDFRYYKNFDADVFTLVIVFQRALPAQEYEAEYLKSDEGAIVGLEESRVAVQSGSNDNWLPLDPIYSDILQNGKTVRLKTIAECMDVGINYQRKNVGWQNREASRIAERILYEGVRQNVADMAYLKGEDIEPYCCTFGDRWLRHDFMSNLAVEESVSVNHVAAKLSPKILSRQTGDSIVAAVDRHAFYTGRSLHTTIVIEAGYSVEYLVAILNSKLITYVYRGLSQEEGRALAQVNLANVRQLPIRAIAFITPESERAQLAALANTLYGQYVQTGDSSGLLGFAARCLPPCEEKSDVIHDLLAYLAERMTEMHKQRQAEQREFLTWLERYFCVAIDDLTGKTKLREYYDPAQCKDFADLVATLKKNRGKVQRDLGSELVLAPLRKRYEESLAVIGPLKREIDLTDKLIDQLVYKLYGLTDDEIAIVEGRSA